MRYPSYMRDVPRATLVLTPNDNACIRLGVIDISSVVTDFPFTESPTI